MAKQILNGIEYFGNSAFYACDLLLENTNFTPTSGTSDVTRAYTLSASIDNYDAVLVYAYMNARENAQNQLMSMLVNKAEYYVTADSSNWVFLLNGSIASGNRRLCFKFSDSSHITTLANRTSDVEEPRLYKVYGIRFGSKLQTNNSVARVIHVKGSLIYDGNNHISGIGCATITLNNGVATIDFALQFTSSSATGDEFDWGISRDLLKALNPLVPNITPVNGGFWDFYGYNSTLTQIAPAFQASGNLWKFGRYYENTMAAIGNWPSRVFSNGNHLHGVIYGTYNT
jgi:hypothetical protein